MHLFPAGAPRPIPDPTAPSLPDPTHITLTCSRMPLPCHFPAPNRPFHSGLWLAAIWSHQPRTRSERSLSLCLPASPTLAGNTQQVHPSHLHPPIPSLRPLIPSPDPSGQARCRTGTVVPLSSLSAMQFPAVGSTLGCAMGTAPHHRAAVPTPGCGCCQQQVKTCRNITQRAFEACRRCWAPSRGEGSWNERAGAKKQRGRSKVKLFI